jgi:hypothetical protein
MFSELMHRSSHDDERTVTDCEAHRFLRLVVFYPKAPSRSQRQRANYIPYFRLVIGVHPHAAIT